MSRGEGIGSGGLTAVAVGLAVACAAGSFALPADEVAEAPLIIHQITADPGDADRFYAITSNMGVLASRDGGRRWSHANHGLRSFTHHALIAVGAAGSEPPLLLAGGWGGGVSISRDRAATWTERNGDLSNTAIDALAPDPSDASQWYAATSTGVFRSTDGGMRWEPFDQGLPRLSEAVGYKSLAIEVGGRLWLGTEGGLFRRERDAGRWVGDPALSSARVTTVISDPRIGRVYVGTIKQGISVGAGHGWQRVGDPGWFVSRIVLHPREPSRVYAATRGAGVFTSDDAGATWKPLGKGLSDPDVRSLSVHPVTPSRLAAGTTSSGIFYSHDGGASWRAAERVTRQTMSQIVAMLAAGASRRDTPPVPPAFAKCNRCHGWTHQGLNAKHTYWRVPPNPRQWGSTVERMAARAELTENERADVTRFLTEYSGALTP